MVVTVLWTCLTLASDTIIPIETLTDTSFAITNTFIRALYPWVKVICPYYTPNPSEILRTSALRTIRACPLRLTINPNIALTIVILGTVTISRASTRTHTYLTYMDFLIRHILSPELLDIGRHGGWDTSGLPGREATRLSRRL